jgi:GNAT superfamily N-acetyltransferase
VERLFTAAMVRIAPADPRHPHALAAKRRYFEELGVRFEEGYDPAAAIQVGDDDLVPPAGVLLLATLHAAPVGCAIAKFHPDGTAHAKRMWIADEVRGLGLGRRILAALEDAARANGARRVRLETHRSLHEAIGLYRSSGYREVERFNDEIYGHHFFEKDLA